MTPTAFPRVVGKEGLLGRLETAPSGTAALPERVMIRLEDGRQMQVPQALLTAQEDGSFFLPLTLLELEQTSSSSLVTEQETLTVPVLAEELRVGTRTVETGRVRFHKTVAEHEEVVDVPLLRQQVVVEHVPINHLCDGEVPGVRQEGDLLIIPILEEVLVVEKRLMLKEEIHVHREQSTFHEPQRVVLRREEVQVERVAAPEGSEASEMAPG